MYRSSLDFRKEKIQLESSENMPTIHIAGDSTASIKEEQKRPETGWGEKFASHFAQLFPSIIKQ